MLPMAIVAEEEIREERRRNVHLDYRKSLDKRRSIFRTKAFIEDPNYLFSKNCQSICDETSWYEKDDRSCVQNRKIEKFWHRDYL